MRRRELILAGLAAGLGSGVLANRAVAQSYPDRPIRLVQGFAPGGNADNIARLVGGEMAKGLGQSVIVEPTPGAGGTIASTKVANAPADGYTLLLATGGHAVAGALYKQLAYDTVDSFDMIGTITFFPFLVVANAEKGPRTMSALLDAARTSSDGITYGSAGIGTTQHLTGELLASMGKVKLVHVPYRGDTGALTALIGGEVQFVIAPATAALPHVQSGRLVALAATGPERWKGLPDLGTVAEQGVAGFDVQSWAGIIAPKGLPRPVVDRLNGELQKALQVPDVRTKLETFGGVVKGGTPEEMRQMLTQQLNNWKEVVARAGLPRQ